MTANGQDGQPAIRSDGVDETTHLQSNAHFVRVRLVSRLQSRGASGWGLWFKWALASAIFSIPLLTMVLYGNLTNFVVACFLIGSVSALAQWVVLRPYVPNLNLKKWVLTNAVGYLLVGLSYVGSLVAAAAIVVLYSGFLYFKYGVHGPEHPPELIVAAEVVWWPLLLVGVGFLVIIGTAQWITLHDYLPNARRLILSNITASIILQLSNLLVRYLITDGRAIEASALSGTIQNGWNVTLILVGTITGVTLVQLLRRYNKTM